MKPFKRQSATGASDNQPASEVVSLGGFFDALRYLSEREETVLTEIPDAIGDGFLFLSFEMTARLFMQISSIIPSPVLKISLFDEKMRITVSNKDGGAVPLRAALKLAKTAFLAGFDTDFSEDEIFLTVSVSRERELAVYARSLSSLLDAFKKYFKI